jgi:ribosomal protein L11 methyltransferase
LARTYPALDVRCDDQDLLLADVDDFHPTAVEDRDGTTRIFFTTTVERDAARGALASRYTIEPLDVSDENWARRSQENLKPITIGRLIVLPTPDSRLPNSDTIVVQPSMGFGTGHHATTQLCLEALQTLALDGAEVLDVGTGSGVLALAAVQLGAARAHGIDIDEDAVTAARENATHNPDLADRVAFEVADIASFSNRMSAKPAVITANLTGALLVRSAPLLLDAAAAGGTLILSGLQVDERDAVVRAFAPAPIVWERVVGEWVGMAVKRS